MAEITIWGVGWALFLCLLALFINVMRWLNDEQQYELRLSYFGFSWFILWGVHCLFIYPTYFF